MRAVIFDLDGTLVDSLPGIAAGLNQALEEAGFPGHSEERVRTFIGNGSRMLVKRGLGGDPPEDLVDRTLALFFEAYQATWRPGTTPYPGISDLLTELRSDRLPLAVFSNKPHRFTVEMTRELFPDCFDSIRGQQDELPRKPDPTGAHLIAEELGIPPEEVAFVGDSTVDFETAVAAGMTPVMVGWGFHNPEQLSATAAPLQSSAADLRRFLQELHRAG